ncbi:MAG: hypothetical protein OEU36_16815 [Gammaproteobacteria bacterium]|nr:hypothetical protein [Gammaproteobacteria bacterium]
MRRRTPIVAIILAPIAIWALLQLWQHALLPLYVSIWRSESVLQLRLASDDSRIRTQALQQAMSARPEDEELIRKIVEIMQADVVMEVRTNAAHTLGQIGHRQPLPSDVKQALGGVVLTAQDHAMLSAAIRAVGQSAAQNEYPDAVIQRIAGIFNDERLAWVYSSAAQALGQIGAAQPLPGTVFDLMNALFEDTERPSERENLARAFAEISEGQSLPTTTLDALADTLEHEPDYRIRVQAIYSLAHAATNYSQSKALITATTQDTHQNVRSAAEHGLRIIESNKLYANRDPMSVALDRSLPVGDRVKAMGALKVNNNDPTWREQVLSLARDDDPQVMVAALGLFTYIDGSPEDDFDKGSLIPQLTSAMSHPDPQVRRAAYGTLSTQFIHNHRYRRSANKFRPLLETGAQDSDAKVRVVALAAMFGGDASAAEHDAILKRGLNDPDPYVRRLVVDWLSSPRAKTSERQALFEQALQDEDTSVREVAAQAQQKWQSRKRAWPYELLRLWQSGEYSKLGLTVLTAVTVAAPVVIGGIFLIYYVARLLTYLYQRRWRSITVVPVIAVWAAASYGMFMLYFMAAHAGHLNTRETVQLAGILWGAIVVYAAAGWGMHYLIRR